MWVLRGIVSVFLEIKSKYLHSIFSSIVLKRYAYGANTTKLSTGLVIQHFLLIERQDTKMAKISLVDHLASRIYSQLRYIGYRTWL